MSTTVRMGEMKLEAILALQPQCMCTINRLCRLADCFLFQMILKTQKTGAKHAVVCLSTPNNKNVEIVTHWDYVLSCNPAHINPVLSCS